MSETSKSTVGSNKIPTGIKGLDEVLYGGFPRGRTMLINGSTGSGKTVFMNEFLYRGITMYNENGLFVTLEEKPEYIIRNVEKFGWDYRKLIEEKKLKFVDLSPEVDTLELELDEKYSLNPIIERITHGVKSINAKRVVIDNLGTLYDRYSQKGVIRNLMLKLIWSLNDLDINSLISSETKPGSSIYSKFGVEEFVADGVIGLELDLGDQEYKRKIYVRKIRGENYRSGVLEFEINSSGLRVYPKIPYKNYDAKTSFEVRKKTGIKDLDEALDGGIPEGHVMLISGNTGTGKTLLGFHFINEGIQNGEKAVIVSLEEPVEQVKKTAAQFGWDFDKYEKDSSLSFVTSPLIDIRPDKLLYKILDVCKENDAKRVVIDSISSLQSATFDRDKVRQFLIQLTGFMKEKGITCFCNYLSGTNFSGTKEQLLASQETNKMKLSSIIDGVILMIYTERDDKVGKVMNILKLRGSKHERRIIKYEIGSSGIKFI